MTNATLPLQGDNPCSCAQSQEPITAPVLLRSNGYAMFDPMPCDEAVHWLCDERESYDHSSQEAPSRISTDFERSQADTCGATT